MKAIRKYFKTTLCFMAFIAMSFVCALSPMISSVYTVYAAASTSSSLNYTAFFSAIKIPNTTVDVKNGGEFKIPYLETSDLIDSTYEIYVISPSGQTHIYTVGGSNDSSYFDDTTYSTAGDKYLTLNALNNGTYTIIYNVDGYYSNEYKIKVTNVSYLLDFTDSTGLKYLIASNYATGSTLDLPVPSIVYATLNDDGEYDSTNYTYSMDNVTVTFNGEKITVNQGKTINGNDYQLYTYDSDTYTVNFSVEGTYKIEYSYPYGSNPQTVTYTITVSNDFTNPSSSDITISDVTMPTIELGQTVTLPSLTISDGLSDNADYNITSIRIEKDSDSSIYQELTNNTLTFNMTLDDFRKNYNGGELTYSDLKGTYNITYTIVDAYGTEKTLTKVVRNVTDSTKPSVYLAYEYEVNEDKEVVGEVDTGYAVELKTTYGYTELIFPAIYAEDAVSEYSEFTFIRYIKNTSTSKIYYLDNISGVDDDGNPIYVEFGKSGYNYYYDDTDHSGEDVPGANQYVKFQFTETGDDDGNYSGEYQLCYYVIANTISEQKSYVYETGTTYYTFTISNSETETITSSPDVEFNNLDAKKTYTAGDELSINITATDDNDSRLKNIIFYYTSTSSSTLSDDIEGAIKAAIDAEKNASYITSNVLDSDTFKTQMETKYTGFGICAQDEDSTTTFALTLPDNITELTVVAVSINYEGNFGYASKTLTLKNTSETDVPIFDSTDGIVSGGDLFYTRTTASAVNTFNGNSNANVGDAVVGRIIYDDDGTTVSAINTTYTNSNDEPVNFTTLGVGQAETVTLPTLAFSDVTDDTLALSVVYYIDSPISDTGVTYLGTVGSKVTGNNIYGGTITTSEVGTYYVVYTATDDAGNSTAVFFSFVVVESSDMKLSITPSTSDEDTTISGGNITGYTDAIVNFDVSVLSTYNNADLTSNCDIDYDIDDAGAGLKTVRTSDGEYSIQFVDAGNYTVVFTAVNKDDGRTATSRTYYVTITTPTLAWDKVISVSSTAAKGEKVTLTDATASEGSTQAVVTVSVKDPSGNVWETMTDTSIDIDDASDSTYRDGNYVLLQVLEDENGNSGNTVWVFYTSSELTGNYTVTYTAKTANSTLTQSFTVKVGDNVEPTITMDYANELGQDLVYDGENQIEYTIDLDKTNNTLIIYAYCNGEKLFYYNTNLSISDYNDSTGNTTDMTSWTNLTVTLSSDDGIVDDGEDEDDGVYYITGTGTCTLTISIPDSNENTATKKISFNVVSTDTTSSSISDTTIGVILIIVSLVVLAGVILFFTFTGRKGDGASSSKVKKNSKKVSDKTESDNSDVEDTTSDSEDAKTGEIE